MLHSNYSGQNDIISLSDGHHVFTASFYALMAALDKLRSDVPPPCPECDGTGDIVLEERDLVICGTCKGSRIQAQGS